MRAAGLSLVRGPSWLLVSAARRTVQRRRRGRRRAARVTPRGRAGGGGEFPYATGELGHLVARVSSTRGIKSRPGIKPGEFYVHKIECYPGINTVPMEVRTWMRYEAPLHTNNPSHVMVNEKWRPAVERFQKEHPASIYETYVQDDTLHNFVYGHPRHVQHADQAENSIYNAAGILLSLDLYREIRRRTSSPSSRKGCSAIRPASRSASITRIPKWAAAGWCRGDSIGGRRGHGSRRRALADGARCGLGARALRAALAKFDTAHRTKLRLEWERAGTRGADRAAAGARSGARRGGDAGDRRVDAAGGGGGDERPLLPAAIPFDAECARAGDMHGHVRDESISRREIQIERRVRGGAVALGDRGGAAGGAVTHACSQLASARGLAKSPGHPHEERMQYPLTDDNAVFASAPATSPIAKWRRWRRPMPRRRGIPPRRWRARPRPASWDCSCRRSSAAAAPATSP